MVLTFIAGTMGLLGWAGVRKLVEKRNAAATGIGLGDTQQGYSAVEGR